MAGNDISSLIQDIYDRYKENQKDKKTENRIYMSEEEFKTNLRTIVNKSKVEDKFMLYNEIYLQISEDALEIDTTGNITISPKVIVNAEKEVAKRLEQQNALKNNVIDKEKKFREKYEKMTEAERTDGAVKGMSALFGWGREETEKFWKIADKMDFSKLDDSLEIADKLRENDLMPTPDIKSAMGEKYGKDNIGDAEATFLALTDESLKIFAESPYGKLLLKDVVNPETGEKEKKLSKDLWNRIFEQLQEGGEISNTFLIDYLKETGKLEELDKIPGGFKIEDFTMFVAGLKNFFEIRDQVISTKDNGKKSYLDSEFLRKMSQQNMLIRDNGYEDIIKYKKGFEDLFILCSHARKTVMNQGKSQGIENYIQTNDGLDELVYGTISKEKLQGMVSEMGEKKQDYLDAARRITNENITFDVSDIDPLYWEKYMSLGRTEGIPVDVLSQFARDAVVDQSKLVNSRSMDIEGTTKKYEGVTIDNPKESVTFENVDLSEADFESSLASISDMEPDMFAGMFESMAEEIVFEEPTFETEKVVQEDETHEVAGDDRTAQGEKETQILEEVDTEELTEKEVKGIQVEDINVDETLTNTMNNENLPKKITWVDKVRASVDAFGKNVKKAFGSFISAITGKGGENNSAANNSTSSTSSSAGQNKHVQEVKNFVPTVELNLKQAQQATKAAEESKKNNDARGTDEPIQDDSEIGE